MQMVPFSFTLRQLQYVCAVAQTLSFRGAAQACHVSQPSLSMQIAEVERGLGVQLFERDRSGVVITRAGEQVIKQARAMLIQAQDLSDLASVLSNPLEGELVLGVLPTVAPYLLPELDMTLRRAYPKLEIQWVEDRTEVLIELVELGRLDAALVAQESSIDHLHLEPLIDDPFVLAVSLDHPMGQTTSALSSDAIMALDMLLLTDGHCFRKQVLDICAQAAGMDVGFQATSLTTLVQLIAGRGGATLLPRMSLDVENRDRTLCIRPIEDDAFQRTVVMAWRRQCAIREALKDVATVASDCCHRLWC